MFCLSCSSARTLCRLLLYFSVYLPLHSMNFENSVHYVTQGKVTRFRDDGPHPHAAIEPCNSSMTMWQGWVISAIRGQSLCSKRRQCCESFSESNPCPNRWPRAMNHSPIRWATRVCQVETEWPSQPRSLSGVGRGKRDPLSGAGRGNRGRARCRCNCSTHIT